MISLSLGAAIASVNRRINQNKCLDNAISANFVNSYAPGRGSCYFELAMNRLISRTYIYNISSNCPQVNAIRPHWWLVNIGSSNGRMPPGNQATTWTDVDTDLCRHLASPGANQIDNGSTCLYVPAGYTGMSRWRHNMPAVVCRVGFWFVCRAFSPARCHFQH